MFWFEQPRESVIEAWLSFAFSCQRGTRKAGGKHGYQGGNGGREEVEVVVVVVVIRNSLSLAQHLYSFRTPTYLPGGSNYGHQRRFLPSLPIVFLLTFTILSTSSPAPPLLLVPYHHPSLASLS